MSSDTNSDDDTNVSTHDGINRVASAIEAATHGYDDDGSHTEREDPSVFHPSSLGNCRRQMYLDKLGISDSSEHQGKMHVGTVIHEWLENHAVPYVADHFGIPEGNVFTEVPAQYDAPNGVRITGTADLYLPTENVVIDYKTRGGWYSFEANDDGYITQVSAYARALDVINVGIVYINRKDSLDLRTYPDDGWSLRNEELLGDALRRAEDVMRAIERNGIATGEDEIPFEKCDRDDGGPCYFCRSEELNFSADTESGENHE